MGSHRGDACSRPRGRTRRVNRDPRGAATTLSPRSTSRVLAWCASFEKDLEVVSFAGTPSAAQARGNRVDRDKLGRRRQADRSSSTSTGSPAILAGPRDTREPLGEAVAYAVNSGRRSHSLIFLIFLDDPLAGSPSDRHVRRGSTCCTIAMSSADDQRDVDPVTHGGPVYRVPLSNARVECHQRDTAIGRRYFFFAGFDNAARRFAILHTLILDYDLVGAPPFEYLRNGFRCLADDGAAARIRELLPAAWLADRRRQQQQAEQASEAVDDVAAAVVPATKHRCSRMTARREFRRRNRPPPRGAILKTATPISVLDSGFSRQIRKGWSVGLRGENFAAHRPGLLRHMIVRVPVTRPPIDTLEVRILPDISRYGGPLFA